MNLAGLITYHNINNRDYRMIRIEEETFNKVMNVLGQLPYAQVAGLLQEVGNNMEQENGVDSLSANDSDVGEDRCSND